MAFRTNGGRGSNGHGVALFSGSLVAESANATNLQITTQPGLSGTTPYTLSPQPVVAAKKSLGTTDTAYVTAVVASLNVLSGSPVLSGTTTKTPVSGVATFTDLVVTGAGTWTITFTSGTLASAVSSTGTTTGSGGFTPFDLQLNFRGTATGVNSGGVTDGAGQTYVLFSDTYTGSVIRGSTSAAWGYTTNTGVDGRDRQATPTVPAPLCGINFCDGVNDGVFRIDLPAAGTYDVHLAIGDGANDVTVSKITVKDGATTLFGGVDWGNTLALHYKDATGADRYFNNTGGIGWVETNVPVSCTFAGTVMNVVIDKASRITALRVVRTA